MKKAIILFLLTLALCAPKEDKKKELAKDLLMLNLLQNAYILQTAYENSECVSYSGPLNPLYLTSSYYFNFKADQKQYQNIIIGDSTMDISIRYSGFIDPNITQAVPISGNKLCDMITQLPAINTTNPTNIIVSTTGGNDVLEGIQNGSVVYTGELLIKRLKEKYPNSKLIMVAIHPTQSTYANANKGYVNSNINAKLNSYYPVNKRCFVDPLVLFGVAEGAASNTSDMITNDGIHYNQAMSFQIKNKIQTDCGVAF